MNSDFVRQCAVAGAVGAGIVSGATGDYGESEDSPSPLLPADYAFTVWAPIYVGAVGYAWYHGRPSRRGESLLRRTGWPMAAAIGLSGVWVRVQEPPVLQLPAIAATMCAAGTALRRAQPRSVVEDSPAQRWFVQVPVGLLAGWLTLATTAATTEVLIASGVPSPPIGTDRGGAVVLAATAAAALAATLLLPRTTAYGAAVAWGLVGVAVRGARRWPVTSSVSAAGAVAMAAAAARRPALDQC